MQFTLLELVLQLVQAQPLLQLLEQPHLLLEVLPLLLLVEHPLLSSRKKSLL